jgi:hypothetical protein
MTWVLIIYLATTELYFPIASYRTEAECLAAIEKWTFESDAKGICLPGTIEATPQRQRRKPK